MSRAKAIQYDALAKSRKCILQSAISVKQIRKNCLTTEAARSSSDNKSHKRLKKVHNPNKKIKQMIKGADCRRKDL